MKDFTSTKGIVTVVSSLMYLAGFGLFIRNVGQGLFGSSGNGANILFPLILSAAACFILGWFNSKSLTLAFLGTIITLVVGIPLSYLLLNPVTEAIVKSIMPNTNLLLSGSFSATWFVLIPPIIIEIVTDNVIQYKRWNQLVVGVLVILLLILGIELLTSNLGQNSRLDIGRLVVYTPVTWWLVVFLVSLKKGDEQ